ncbi:MAG: DUF1499 domain-containing protein [Pseudazoarcus pumilus]|nr:DUF1499 domain-containing protein [Pseudazoarcus pumilus]
MSARSSCPLAPLSVVLALGAVLAILTGGLGYRAGWWHFLIGLRIAEWAAYASAVALVLGLVGVWMSRGAEAKRGFIAALLGIALALPVVGVALQWEISARNHPPINDISTDLDDPPVFWDTPDPADHPGTQVAELQRQGYPDLAPLQIALPPQQAFERALALVRERGWEVIAADDVELRIEATASSRLYGFTDEIVIRVRETPDGARIDLRSRSRLGRIDRGVNAARIRAFFADLAPRLQGDRS